MRRKSTLKQMYQEVPIMLGIGVSGSIGTRVISQAAVGTPVATTAPAGVSKVMAGMPVLGTVMGAKYTVGVLREAFSMPKSKKKLKL